MDGASAEEREKGLTISTRTMVFWLRLAGHTLVYTVYTLYDTTVYTPVISANDGQTLFQVTTTTTSLFYKKSWFHLKTRSIVV